jgi:hypothetical protein
MAALRTRFSRPVFLWALLGLVTNLTLDRLFAAGWLGPNLHLLRLLPLIPEAFFLVALVRTIRKMDEMQQRICLESIAAAFILTLVLTFVVGGLEAAGVPYAPLRDGLGTFMLFSFACAYVVSVRRYR